MKPPAKILDGFAGIGGFSYAAHKIVGGFETTQFIEIDKPDDYQIRTTDY